MITKLTGRLMRVLDDEVRMAVGPFEYQVLVPEAVRRQVQLLTGQEMTLHISEYLEEALSCMGLASAFEVPDELKLEEPDEDLEEINAEKNP